jgi:1-phosphatidylinositol-4-phosphate 5-kinase
MPSAATENLRPALSNSTNSSFDGIPRKSHDKTLTASGVFTYTNGTDVETGLPDHRFEQFKAVRNQSHTSLTNGLSHRNSRSRDRSGSKSGSTHSVSREDRSIPPIDGLSKLSNVENASEPFPDSPSRERAQSHPANLKVNIPTVRTEQHEDAHMNTAATAPDTAYASNSDSLSPTNTRHLQPQRISAPAGLSPIPTRQKDSSEPPQLTHRHTALGVPRSGTNRTSRDFSFSGGPSEEVLHASGRFSPTRDTHEHRHRRASLNLIRRQTRSQSDAHLDEVPPDEDAARWTEIVKQKRASRRARRREEDEDDRVIVGKKVEEGHVNWVTAYNMLTGIRFTVSRTNAKMDRQLTDADFEARHKLSFDVTGNELTPSAKYDFKFKDYAPWVFRHLRAIFGLDPADYLMSLTSKYILSELGSPGKSGSFFYFSRDYKYIIKTIHHAEHKLLRRILRDYYNHVVDNPNTLISQIYGLHRVKIPYGRKIHFLVMNNLFPPHRDIHQTFDLKGSTVGRDFKEDELPENPRATLKDLNWLRRDYHLEFDHRVKQLFIEQLQRDVALLQKLHIMDYSLLVGIHDLNKGNEEGLRETTLRVFQPGGNEDEPHGMLMRTPSRLENARKARELRMTLRKERPVPINLVKTQMPDEMEVDDIRKDRLFYKDDGGIRATHEDGGPGELVYYLGVIDCLTHVRFLLILPFPL